MLHDKANGPYKIMYISKSSIIINAPAAKVWQALTDPAMVKQWLYGTEMKAEWKVGGKITYTGSWEGKNYQDKGEILELEPEKKLVSTYWSGISGKADIPENYQVVSYILEPDGQMTKLTITQENEKEESVKQATENWNSVLENLKRIILG